MKRMFLAAVAASLPALMGNAGFSAADPENP